MLHINIIKIRGKEKETEKKSQYAYKVKIAPGNNPKMVLPIITL